MTENVEATQEMIAAASKDYSEFLNLDLDTKLKPINQSIDDMLTRLEEFETMVLLIQQERCNAIGLTGSLTDCVDLQPHIQNLCQRIDSLEALTEYLKTHYNALETKVEMLEEKMGLADSSNVFKSFLKSSIFKKAPEVKPSTSTINEPLPELSIDQYFIQEKGNDESN